MQRITIQECSNAILAEFERNQYTENTLRTKTIAFNCINRWFLDYGTPQYGSNMKSIVSKELYQISKVLSVGLQSFSDQRPIY